MQLENPLTFVRSLKGAPASILWAYFFARKAMTALELQEWTGYKGDNITEAVRFLVSAGWLVARSPRGPWCLADGRQFPLMAESDLIGVSPTTTTTIEERKLISDSLVVAAATNPIKSELQVLLEEYGIPVEENLKACKLFGIGEPMRTQLAQMKHVTPEFIEAHVRSLVDGETLGLAIVRIKSDELPRLWMAELNEWEGIGLHEYKQARKAGYSLAEYQDQDEEESEEE